MANSAHQKTLVILDGICLAAVVALALLVDANGNIKGLSHTASITTTILFFGVAFVIAIALTALGQRWWRAMGVVSLLLYLALLAPLLF